MHSSGQAINSGSRKDYSPYHQHLHQRPSSAGVTRSRSRGHSAGGNGSRGGVSYQQQQNHGGSGAQNIYGQTPVISAGLRGSGYQNYGSSGRPPSAGTRTSRSSSRQQQHQQQQEGMPLLPQHINSGGRDG